ncbi:MAG: EF-hand domain-containing protein [Gemmataceae bacterium]|nr:EF-hand domain-containing protein [Gemmataceae bacterium]
MFARWNLQLCGCFFLCATLVSGQDRPQQKKERPKAANAVQLLERMDKNKDGFLDQSEVPERIKERFKELDSNNDGKLSRQELEKAAPRLGQEPAPEVAPDALFRLLDANKDGKLSKEELQNAPKLLEKLDRNKDGMLDGDELKAAPKKKKQQGRPGEVITPAAKGERLKDKLKAGDEAPDFTLPDPKGTAQLTLSSFRGKKPVVLVFASYT